MGLFKKSKKESSCCNFQIEDVGKSKKSSCCDFNIEDVEPIEDENKPTKSDEKSCNNSGCCS